MKYMFMSHHQNSEQSHNKKRANKSLGNVAKSKHFRTTVTVQTYSQKKLRTV